MCGVLPFEAYLRKIAFVQRKIEGLTFLAKLRRRQRLRLLLRRLTIDGVRSHCGEEEEEEEEG